MNLKIIAQSENERKQKNLVKLTQNTKNKKMSRNEPCFCGSGKKYKRCCGAL